MKSFNVLYLENHSEDCEIHCIVEIHYDCV